MNFIRHQSDIKSRKKQKDRQRNRYVQKNHTFNAEHARTLKTKQFHDSNTLILAACPMSVHYSQSHHHLEASLTQWRNSYTCSFVVEIYDRVSPC